MLALRSRTSPPSPDREGGRRLTRAAARHCLLTGMLVLLAAAKAAPGPGGAIVTEADDQAIAVVGDLSVAKPAAPRVSLSNMTVRFAPFAAKLARMPLEVDPVRWRDLGEGRDTRAGIRHLLYRVSQAPNAERQARRWDLARYYVGMGYAAEAAGVLGVMIADEPALELSPIFRATRGIVRVQLGDSRGAVADLGQPELAAVPEACLWRGLAHERLGQSSESLEALRCGEAALDDRSASAQAPFLRAGIRADMAKLEGGAIARQLVERLESDDDEANFWRGMLALRAGDPSRAALHLAAARDGNSPPIALRATVALIEDDLANKAITPAQAIKRLEPLRFRWRGGAAERALLARLGALYEQTGNLRGALDAYGVLARYYPSDSNAQAFNLRRTELFRRALADGGSALAPAQAFGLYWDFRDLAPKGAEGDALIRLLADRLVALDLLDQAASLLEYQVRYRLEGTAQAVVAMRLAEVLVLNAQPDKALGVLYATRQEELAPDIRTARARIMAEALVALGRYDEAAALLEEDASDFAERLRRELYWQSKDWPRLIASLKPRLPEPNGLSNQDRNDVLRYAIAAAMQDNEGELRWLRGRYRTSLAQGPLAAAFDVITADPGTVTPERTRVALDQAARFIAGDRGILSNVPRVAAMKQPAETPKAAPQPAAAAPAVPSGGKTA